MDLSEAMRLRIQELIAEYNTNGNKLALSSGFNRSNISKFLRKKHKIIKIESIALICQSLEISLKDFFDSKLFDDVEVND